MGFQNHSFGFCNSFLLDLRKRQTDRGWVACTLKIPHQFASCLSFPIQRQYWNSLNRFEMQRGMNLIWVCERKRKKRNFRFMMPLPMNAQHGRCSLPSYFISSAIVISSAMGASRPNSLYAQIIVCCQNENRNFAILFISDDDRWFGTPKAINNNTRLMFCSCFRASSIVLEYYLA